MQDRTISSNTLASVPLRRSRKDIVVLKFGGTTVGATPAQGRIRLARQTIANLLGEGKFVVPVFSAYRRGRSADTKKFSVTDILQNHKSLVAANEDSTQGVAEVCRQLREAHMTLIDDLGLNDGHANDNHANDNSVIQEVEAELDALRSNIALSCSAFEDIPSLKDVIITAGERLAVKILSAYLNDQFRQGRFPLQTAPVTALELGIYTDNRFGSATINWARAVDHSREMIVGQYLERNILPIVTGFDGIYDPHNEFKEIMQTNHDQGDSLDQRYARVYRTSLGRGGSDLTATFLGFALGAEYVGFCKETPGVLTGDDLLVGETAQTVHELDYDLATEAGNIYARAVEPVQAGGVPVHIFDPARPETRTVVSDIPLPAGLYIIERPLEAVNIHAGTIPDEPGALMEFLQVFADHGVNVEEIRHQRSGTDCIVCGDESAVQKCVTQLHKQGMQPQAHFTWYLRAIGNITPELAAEFNRFMKTFEPLTSASYQIGAKVLTATIVRNRAGTQLDESQRIKRIVCKIHDQLVAHSPRSLSGAADSSSVNDPGAELVASAEGASDQAVSASAEPGNTSCSVAIPE